MTKRKLYPGVEVGWNPFTDLGILGFIHWWKWYQVDRFGFTLAIGYLYIVIGRPSGECYIDPLDLPEDER